MVEELFVDGAAEPPGVGALSVVLECVVLTVKFMEPAEFSLPSTRVSIRDGLVVMDEVGVEVELVNSLFVSGTCENAKEVIYSLKKKRTGLGFGFDNERESEEKKSAVSILKYLVWPQRST